MTKWTLLLVVSFLVALKRASSFTTSITTTTNTLLSNKVTSERPLIRLQERLAADAHGSSEFEDSRRKRRCSPCPEEESGDIEMDRREAAFAMLGSLWAVGVIPSAAVMMPTEAAHAAYGQDAKISLPNPVESMADRLTKQCIVESLGSRECLVYMDPANKLYQGTDNQVLLERVEKSSAALATIPELLESKKWSQVSGVLTGPMGNLVTTMNQLIKASTNSAESTDLKNKFKTDIYDINAFADQKQEDKALQSHKLATEHLVAFVESL